MNNEIVYWTGIIILNIICTRLRHWSDLRSLMQTSAIETMFQDFVEARFPTAPYGIEFKAN